MTKERLDKYLTDLGYFDTKSKAAAAILAAHVKINDEYITKAGFQINPEKEYDIVVKSMPYVSRGGFKLKKALEHSILRYKTEFALMQALLRVDLQTACFKTERNLFMLLMSVTVSLIGKSDLAKK